MNLSRSHGFSVGLTQRGVCGVATKPQGDASLGILTQSLLCHSRDVKAAGPTWLVVSLQHHSSGNKREQISEAKGNVGAKTFSRKEGETCRCTPGAAQPERENKPTAVAGK